MPDDMSQNGALVELVSADARNDHEAESAYLAARAREAHIQASNVPQHLRIKNRRRRYLELHPEYFGPHLELADPLLYDRLIRRFQTNSEREAEGRKKGYSGVLEADLHRSEAKLHALQHPDPGASISYKRGKHGEILEEERDEVPVSKEDGVKRWKEEMERRFVEGRDGDFDYGAVDEDVRLDNGDEEGRVVDEWFEKESPDWPDGKVQGRELEGETGVQDF